MGDLILGVILQYMVYASFSSGGKELTFFWHAIPVCNWQCCALGGEFGQPVGQCPLQVIQSTEMQILCVSYLWCYSYT